jgi:Holliday junction resolvase RusA-like endonuclease
MGEYDEAVEGGGVGMGNHYEDIAAIYQRLARTDEMVIRPGMAFSVACVPVPQPRQRHRVVNGAKPYATNYTPATHPVNGFKHLVASEARRCWLGDPLAGAVELHVMFRFPLPASAKAADKRYIAAGAHIAHSSRFDLDNLLKGLFDALTGITWVDDRQIGKLTAEKVYAKEPGVDVWIAEWQP